MIGAACTSESELSDHGGSRHGHWQLSVAYRKQRSHRHFVGTIEQKQRAEQHTEIVNDIHLFDVALTYEFNPRTNTFTHHSASGFTPRHSLGAAAVRTSAGPRIYAVGGYTSTSADAAGKNASAVGLLIATESVKPPLIYASAAAPASTWRSCSRSRLAPAITRMWSRRR